MKKILPKEAFEGLRFAAWLDSLPGVLFTHIRNEERSPIQRAKNHAQGVRAGVPDYFLLCPRGPVFIELKRKSGGKTSAAQKMWIAALMRFGIPAKVCRGFDEAKAFVQEYL